MSALTTEIPTPANTNAANARFSTGPTSEAGKDRVKLNAVKSGLYAQTIVLPEENQAAYDALGLSLTAFWQPCNEVELEAVRNIQNARWRYDRAVAFDFALHAIGAKEQLEHIQTTFPDKEPSAQYVLAEAAAFRANLRTFEQLGRQEGRLRRALDRAEHEMSMLAANRVPVEPAPAQQDPTPPAPNGFVSTKVPVNMPHFVGKKAKQHRRTWLNKNGLQNL